MSLILQQMKNRVKRSNRLSDGRFAQHVDHSVRHLIPIGSVYVYLPIGVLGMDLFQHLDIPFGRNWGQNSVRLWGDIWVEQLFDSFPEDITECFHFSDFVDNYNQLFICLFDGIDVEVRHCHQWYCNWFKRFDINWIFANFLGKLEINTS